MTDYKCPFCGSKELMVTTPYLKPVTHEPIRTPCCKAQAKNMEYSKKRFDPRNPNRPSLDEISKG